MVLLLIIVVAVDWMPFGLMGRLIYGALTLFALYIGWPGWQGFQNRRDRGAGWEGAYVENVGFTLIALFDGFVIIAALDLHAPVWLVIVIALLGILVGRLGVGKVRRSVAGYALEDSVSQTSG